MPINSRSGISNWWLIPSLFFLLLPETARAIEEETRIPPGVSQFHARIASTPAYSEAFDEYGDREPLWKLIIRNEELKGVLSGVLTRESTLIEFLWAYGLNADWILELSIPLERKIQTSGLALKKGVETQSSWDSMIKNLSSETLTGLGDLGFKVGYEMGASTKWFVRGGLLLVLPSGQTGTLKGIHGHSLSEGQVSTEIFLHLNWFPFVHGLRNGVRLGTTSHIKSKRETLSGSKGEYAPGNRLDFNYNWSYERFNWFYAFELHRLLQQESQLLERQKNNGYKDELLMEFGWGNLSELEKRPLMMPWQVRLGHLIPIRGENQPIANAWTISVELFF